MKFSLSQRFLSTIVGSALAIFPISQLVLAADNDVQGLLAYITNVMKRNGYKTTHAPFIDRLDPSDTDHLSFRLEAGVTYSIVGVCDRDCRDLDFTIYDNDGNRLDSDNQPDDIPIVRVTPRWTDRFNLNVEMYQCKSSACAYGIGVFAQEE